MTHGNIPVTWTTILVLGSEMVQWVVGSIIHGGPIELFLVLASAPRLV